MLANENSLIKYKKSTCQLIERNIFYVRFSDNIEIDIKDIKESYHAYSMLSEGVPIYTISDLGVHSTVSAEAREFAQNNKLEAKAEALILHSLSQRILVNFYAKFRKQTHPINSFKDFESALEWLNSLMI